MHDFVRDSVRAALMKARPVPQFMTEMRAHATASPSLTPGALTPDAHARSTCPGTGVHRRRLRYAPAGWPADQDPASLPDSRCRRPAAAALRSAFNSKAGSQSRRMRLSPGRAGREPIPDHGCAPALDRAEEELHLSSLGTLKPLGQIRNSFILAVNDDGLWIVDQHVAHERVLFERVLKQRAAQKVESQRLLMPMVLELSPAQQAVFSEISDELQHNGFEAEPFGARSVAVKIAPAGVEASAVEHMLHELLDQFSREEQSLNLEKIRARIAASIACHAAIKVNMPLEQNKMEWLLAELAKTDHPMSCPHGRPVVLRYSVKDIQRAFKRI